MRFGNGIAFRVGLLLLILLPLRLMSLLLSLLISSTCVVASTWRAELVRSRRAPGMKLNVLGVPRERPASPFQTPVFKKEHYNIVVNYYIML